MSYCVNCGVKLDDFTPKCPLCKTPVYKPDDSTEKVESPFPVKINIPEEKKRKYSAILITALLFLPSVVCCVVNLLLSPETLWSVFVISTNALLWVLFAFPFMLKKPKPYLLIALDATSIAGYASLFFILFHSGKWFLEIFIPLDILSLILGFSLTKYFKGKKHTRLHNIMAILLAVTVAFTGAEITMLFTPHSIIFDCIAISIAVTTFILFVLLAIADRNKHFKIWLSKNFYF